MKHDDNEILIQTSKDSATIRIEGEKNASVNYLEISNELNEVLFGVSKNGHLVGAHLFENESTELNDAEAHSALLGKDSLYVGNAKISFENDKLTFSKLTTIPSVLAAAPYNITTADLGGRDPDELTARQWLVLARNTVSDGTVKARDIFTNPAEWVNLGITYTSNLTEDLQTQLDDINTWILDANSDIDTLESTIQTLAPKDNPVFTTNITTPKIHVSEIMSIQSHLKLGSTHTNDINIFLNSGGTTAETLQITRSGTECRLTTHGGTGQLRSMQPFLCNEDIDIASDKVYKVGGSQISMSDLSDGGDYSTTVNLTSDLALKAPLASPSFSGVPTVPTASTSTDSLQIASTAFVQDRIEQVIGSAPAAMDTLVELSAALGDDDDYAATITSSLALKRNIADSYTQTQVDTKNNSQDTAIGLNTSKRSYPVSEENAVALNTLKTGITSQQASEITANTAKTGITSGQASEISANTAKTGITSGQADAITVNTAKTGITSGQASEITANTAKTGITSGQASEITANTAKTGITSGESDAISENTAKTGITSGQSDAITSNTAKTGITSGESDAITANTAKTGITSGQASEITANTAKIGITSGQASEITANTLKYTTAQVDTSLALKAPLAAADLTGSVGIGDPVKQSGLGLTIHQSGQAESGISIYATGGSDAVINLMENKGTFGGLDGSTGFRCMYDGGDNKFKIRSADDATVNDRLTIERDSGDIVISGNINLAAGKEFQVDGTAVGGGGGTVKVLTQKEDPTAAGYMGSWHNAASVQYGSLFYQIIATDTEIIAFDPTSTHYPFFRLPLLSETDVGFKVICHNFLFNGTLYVYPHLTDSASGTKLIRGWSSTNNNTTNLKFDNVNASNSYRKLVFFLVEYDSDKYWLYQNVDTY